ncbi:cysteinyl-tRNA synthetase [Rhizodiscina lignyota]|uniref:cysteine--tRNA ligase n=1 Tax=Rhizodiscina lignyota TaxID=1504668 RepID=A0A9P4IAZ4_9PEZI|nr:cysteinyl-tRNA synthetase [Rhizodiscina lignyota]
MASQRRQQPPWDPPTSTSSANNSSPPLRIYNSLTREKNDFTPIYNNHVTWYACGPTVYDDSHLGHARNYVTTDIIRRMLQDYFKYDVRFVMNITDVDDKIIVRARQNHFLRQFKSAHPSIDESVVQETRKAVEEYISQNLKKISPTSNNIRGDIQKVEAADASNPVQPRAGVSLEDHAKLLMRVKTVVSAADALDYATSAEPLTPDEFYAMTDDVLSPYLAAHGDTSTFAHDHSPFKTLTTHFEDRFFRDLDDLNVRRPDVITRVTEYVPQIVDFVEKIEDKTYAYATKPDKEGSRSVYFDISTFEKGGNAYARLEPWNRNDQALVADGEGSLSKNTGEKRSDADFALWKSSKEGEPKWHSDRWGPGRPGWHIECSVMASDVLGPKIDIHSGGIDLAFPHHDNEIAQSEAYFHDKATGHQHQWVNYFLHMGHLSIQGAKMSKSLKNFTTIRTSLERGDWTPRSLRTVFLLGPWRDGIEITDDLVKEGQAWESKVTNFFIKAVDRVRNPSGTSSPPDTSALDKAKSDFDDALRDSFDTPKAMQVISNHITDLNSQMKSLSDSTLIESAKWITEMVQMFGLTSGTDSIGWEGMDIPEFSKPWVYALSSMRDTIRREARAKPFNPTSISGQLEAAPDAAPTKGAEPFKKALEDARSDVELLIKDSKPAKDFLDLADRIRDKDLWDLDVYLEDPDDPSRPAVARPLTAELRTQREEKEARAAAKAAEKEKKEKLAREKEAAEREKAKVKPEEMYRTKEWSEWDADGVPTKDKEGNEVSKSKIKTLKKGWEVQKKLRERLGVN